MNAAGAYFSQGKRLNTLHTILIFSAMLGLFALLGWMLFGSMGILWAVMIPVVLFFTTPKISPHMVLRMYGARRLSYAEAPKLHEIVGELSRRAGLTTAPQLTYVPSRVLNAFSVGTQDNSAIALSDGILRYLTLREIAGVLAHELSHISNNDLRLHALADVFTRITSSLSFFGQVLILFYLPMVLFTEAHMPVFFILVLIFAPTISFLLQLALSRTREFDADLTAARLTGDPQGLASALAKMDRYEQSIWDLVFLPGRKVPQPSILRTHPHTKERLERLAAMAGEQKPPVSDHEHIPILPEHFARIERPPRWHWFRPWY
ncbi:MAG TPA: peptidase M48 [Deltaproteobacteria bacterium]|nr:peptidase M48 [Deltaproteobacteria bacterium]